MPGGQSFASGRLLQYAATTTTRNNKRTSSHRSLQMGDHTFHMSYALFYVQPLQLGELDDAAALFAHSPRTCVASVVSICERARVSNKKHHKEAFDTKPLRVSLFFITGTKIRTRRDSHVLVSSLRETR